MAIFPSLFSRIAYFSFYTSLYPLSTVHVWVRFSRTDTCPISPYSEWLGVVVKAEEYGSVRCRVLNGSKGSFPFVLGRYTFQRTLSADIDILDYFQAASIPFLPFLLVRPRTCRGLNRPRLCPKTIWTCITYPWL